MPFLTDLLAWLGALMSADDVCTVSFLELAMDFEAHARRALPAAPQAAFRGTARPLQGRTTDHGDGLSQNCQGYQEVLGAGSA